MDYNSKSIKAVVKVLGVPVDLTSLKMRAKNLVNVPRIG